MSRRVAAAVAVAAVLVAVLAVALSTGPTPGVAVEEVVITAADGTALDASVYRPDVTAPAPAVVLAHGFGGDKQDLADRALHLAERGYVALAYSARGFGASEGAIELDANVEGGDVSALIDWLAEQDGIALDAPNDPIVGMSGASYGGGITLLAGARDARLDALVPIVAWHSLVTALAPDAAADRYNGVFKARWAGLLFAAGVDPAGRTGPDPGAGTPVAGVDPVCGRFSAAICEAYAAIARTGEIDAAARAELAQADVPEGLVAAPTLLVQARSDTLFGLEQSMANAAAVVGPTQQRWIDGGHGAAGDEANRTQVDDAVLAWFDQWLRGAPAADDAGLIWRDGPSGALRSADVARPPVVLEDVALEPQVARGPVRLVNPPGGVPAALSTLPGLGGVGDLIPAADLPGQHAAFQSSALDEDLDVLGAPVTRLRIDSRTGRALLFAKVFDVAPDGTATLVQSQVAPLRVDGLPAEVTVELPTLAHRFVAGHRVRLVLAATDQGFANRREADVYRIDAPGGVDGDGGGAVPGGAAEVGPVVLSVPVPAPGVAPLPDSALPWAGLAVAGTVLVGAAAVVIARRRREPSMVGPRGPGRTMDRSTTSPPVAPAGGAGASPAVQQHPIEIRGLSKTYPDGHVAVEDVSFTVGHAQVFGLLGPNGAGKTTLLRMLLGLIGPTAGEVHLLGARMRPGHPVLARVGALVEGPGFAPYLSGIDNLRSYWAAGAPRHRSRDVAVFERALEVASLGAALDRPVKTYSHGMRQRLAIAQALLGDPELVVLDEPTDGLDPGQIRGMRDVLAGLATEGRTVLVSSHLLAEVEQVCTHVAVMNRGRLVTTCPVSDLVASGSVVIRTSDDDRAHGVVGRIVGPDRVRHQAEGLIVEVNAHGPGHLVTALVRAGVTVHGVAPRQRLEDAFLRLLEDA